MSKFLPRAWLTRVCLAGLLVLAGVGCGGVRLEQAASPAASTEPATTYSSPTFGYSVNLPKGWRRSTRLSLVPGKHPDLTWIVGTDVFTRRTPEDEAAAQVQEIAGPDWSFVVVVEVYPNPQGLSPSQYIASEQSGRLGETIEPVVFSGQPAVKRTNGPNLELVYYLRDGPNIFRVGYRINPQSQPAPATEADLQAIVNSFRFVNR